MSKNCKHLSLYITESYTLVPVAGNKIYEIWEFIYFFLCCVISFEAYKITSQRNLSYCESQLPLLNIIHFNMLSLNIIL